MRDAKPVILVVGGAGYIGSHTCQALCNAGYTPVAFDSLERGHAWAVKWGPLEVGDISDRSRVGAVIERYRPAAILHFAAYAYVAESIAHPVMYYRNNVAGSVELLTAAIECGVDRFVFSSTCATYGLPETLPICESHPQRPINAYGASKLMVERMLADLDAAYGMHHVNLRYFNAAGASPDGEIGESHDPETHLIPLALMAASGDAEPLPILGTDYETRDGTAVRDYVHVVDLADAHVRALEHLLAGGSSVSLNLGTGVGLSVRDIVGAVEGATGRPVPAREMPRRVGDPPVLIADPGEALRLLDWTATHSSVESIVGSAWRWHQLRGAARAHADRASEASSNTR